MSALKSISLFILLSFVYGLSFSQDEQSHEKYKKYEFTPVYSNDTNAYEHGSSVFKGSLSQMQKIELLNGSILDDDLAIFYRVDLTRDGLNEYRVKRREQSKKRMQGLVVDESELKKYETFDGVSVIKTDEIITLFKSSHQLKKGKPAQLWPVGSLGGYEFFGCLHEQPIFNANLFNDENPDLFVITGTGYQDSDLRGGGISGSLALHIFNSENYKKILELELTEMNYKPKHPEAAARKNYYYPKSNYPARNLKFENNEGRKRYSKLFIKDFDDNNKLDLLVWTREYKSRKVTKDNKPGFKLADNKYTWYEENNTGTGFNARAIDIKIAEEWLNKFDLTWKSGWPNETLCTKGKKALPMITIDDDPVLKK